MKNKNLSFLAVFTFLFVVACDPNYFGRALTRNSSIEPDDVTITPIDVPDGADSSLDYFAVDATFNQPATPENIGAEIVFVLDRSGSMSQEVVALKASLQQWISQLEAQELNNYCIGVMSSVIGSESGKLQNASGNAKCLCRDSLSVAEISTKFGENLDAAAQSGNAADDGGEAGFYSFNKSLNDPAVLAFNQNAGCYRLDLTLAPIFLSDENEISSALNGPQETNCSGDTASINSTTYNLDQVMFDNTPFDNVTGGGLFTTTDPDLVTFTPKDTECGEILGRLKYYSDLANPTAPDTYPLLISPNTIAEDLTAYNDNLPTYGNAVVYQAGVDAFPVSAENGPGHGFFEFADLLGQETSDLATANNQTQFNAQMNDIADTLVDAVSAVRVFALNPQVCPGLEDGLVVKVNSTTLITPSQYTYNASTDKVTIKAGVNIPLGALMSFEYVSCE